MPATITVERETVAYMDRARAYKVLIDGQERASVKNGGFVTVKVEPGPHTVAMKIDWCGSQPADIVAEPDSVHRLHCRPKANPLTALYYIVAARNRYISLWPLTSTEDNTNGS